MYRLSQLEISGFKSFVDPVKLDFGGGMTGIVGPNGCGKSNLADAMIWVMGERSAKVLRGGKMEDVIFSGSAQRKPLGMAEVYLSLLRGDGEGDGDRVTIGRRLTRDGTSTYFLDGKRVRLKDVRDLLMDTGLGVRAYSVIEQGRIGTILSGKPQERRRLLEEAAGITHYRERRRLAEIKLEEALANLARLDDIVSEVERSLRSLKRQANAARRYGARKERFRALQRQILEGRWAALRETRTGLAARLEEETAREAEITAHLHREEADLAASREELDRQNQALSELHRKNAELAARIEGKQEFLKGSRRRLDEIAERVAAGREADRLRRARREELVARLEELGRREEELAAERERAASEVSEDERRIVDVERRVSDESERLEKLRASLLSTVADLNGLRGRLHREQMDLEKGELKRRKVEEDLAATLGELEEESARARAAAEAVAALEKQVADGDERLAARREALARSAAEKGELEASLRQVERRRAGLERRREVLSELDRTHRERREDVAQAFHDAGLPQPEFLFDQLRAPDGWEASLDLFLGGLGEAVLVPRESGPLQAAEALAPGKLTAHLIDRRARSAPSAVPSDPAIRSSLAAALELAPDLASALPPAYLVDTAEDAVRLAPQHPGIAFIARDRVWALAGLVHVQGEEARPGVFARSHELEEVAAAIPPVDAELESLAARIARREDAGEEQRAVIAAEETRMGRLREELAVARARHEDLAARERRLTVERETLAAEAAELEREIALVAERAAGLETDLARAVDLNQRLESDFDEAQDRIDAARSDRETARTSGASRRGRLELAEERLESHRAELRRARRERDEIERQLAAWEDEAERLESRRGEIQQAMAAAEEELQSALEGREETRRAVRGAQERWDAGRARLKEDEIRLDSRRAERDAARDRLSELRVEAAAQEREAEHLLESYREAFGGAPPDEPPELEGPIDELEEEMEKMRRLLERLGPVNLLAAEEYDEQEERHAFLTEQRADVAQSVQRLKATIREINQTSTERFSTTFEEVNEHFKDTFTRLFEGGTAEMRLLDEDDLLESGIEIVARPPGKRLQNILLMSGGEKALTAIALLFALFRTKPSPFCILDEVDAPLDDLNTLRFVSLLQKMSAETQFILITHNKITMEQVSTLYGVTMQERGVSSLVSVELDEVQPAVAASEAEAVAVAG